MITLDSLRNPGNASGFNFVSRVRAAKGSAATWWSARVSLPGREQKATGKRFSWVGPARRTPEEAAQDYCDYVNSGKVSYVAVLNGAGHGSLREGLPRDEEVEAALGVLRDARAQRQGAQGYVYCIGEEGYDRAVKIGFSTNPEARVAELQTGNSRKLVLLAKKPGAPEDEVALHQRFIKQNLIGEWFVKDPAILEEFE